MHTICPSISSDENGVNATSETGGDGVYINTAWDITLRHVTIDGGYRNGISVIAAQTLLVEHSIVRNTLGTDPEAGLDIEPNPCIPGRCKHTNFIQDIVFNNVSFEQNWGGGILLSLGSNLGNQSMPITVQFDDCKVNGTGVSEPLDILLLVLQVSADITPAH